MSPMSPRLLRPRASGHPEALSWASRVSANGGTVSGTTLTAVSKFCQDIDSAGIRSKFYRLNLFCGNNLEAALVPLYLAESSSASARGNTIDTNTNFVSGDYSPSASGGGIVGDGSTKHLDTGVTASSLPDECHAAIWLSAQNSTAGTQLYLSSDNFNDAGYYVFGWGRFTNAGLFRIFSTDIVTSANLNTGKHWLGTAKKTGGTNSATVYRNGSQLQQGTSTSMTVGNQSLFVFAGNRKGTATDRTIDRLGMYSLGETMTAAQALSYYTALNTFMGAIGR